MDRRYLSTIAMNYGGGPVGVETMAAALSEPRDAIEDIIEPFLIQCGYLQRTPRGRLLTSHAFRHLGLAEPSRDPAQFGLFGRGKRMTRVPGAISASSCEALLRRTGTPVSASAAPALQRTAPQELRAALRPGTSMPAPTICTSPPQFGCNRRAGCGCITINHS